MKTDDEIERERAAMALVVGPTHAEWYAEACKVEAGDPALLWACRCREALRRSACDLGSLVEATRRLVQACKRLDEGGGGRVRTAVMVAEEVLWRVAIEGNDLVFGDATRDTVAPPGTTEDA